MSENAKEQPKQIGLMKFLKGLDGKNYFVNESEVLYMADNTKNQTLNIYFKNKANPLSIKYAVSKQPTDAPVEQQPVYSGKATANKVTSAEELSEGIPNPSASNPQ